MTAYSRLVIAAMLPLAACSSHSTNDAQLGEGCDFMAPSGITIIVHLSRPATELVDDRASLCREGACATGGIREPGTGPGPLNGASFGGDVFVLADPVDGTEVYADTGDGPFVEGDVYELVLVDATNTKVFDVSGAAHFDLGVCGSASASLQFYPSP